MARAKSAAIEGARGGALVTGYGAIGVLAESIASHKWPWMVPGVVTMAVTTALHAAASAWSDWVSSHNPATPAE